MGRDADRAVGDRVPVLEARVAGMAPAPPPEESAGEDVPRRAARQGLGEPETGAGVPEGVRGSAGQDARVAAGDGAAAGGPGAAPPAGRRADSARREALLGVRAAHAMGRQGQGQGARGAGGAGVGDNLKCLTFVKKKCPTFETFLGLDSARLGCRGGRICEHVALDWTTAFQGRRRQCTTRRREWK